MTKAQTIELEILSKIFFPANALGFVLKNNEFIYAQKNGKIKYAISFGKNLFHKNLNQFKFDYVNNPDGTIRWVYPSNINKPFFLKLYNGSGWRAFLFKTVFKIAFLLGFKKAIKSGSVFVYSTEKKMFEKVFEKYPFKRYAVFTGTVGDDRKAVVAIKGENGKSFFYKIPLTQNANGLVKKEGEALRTINGAGFSKAILPKAEFIGNGIIQTDIKPSFYRSEYDLQLVHIDFFKETVENTLEWDCLKKLKVWNEISERLCQLSRQGIENGLSGEKVKNVIGYLVCIYESIDSYGAWPTVISHGDFTPWNMYLNKEKLHIYDWEMSDRTPPLFDLFHFIFQSSVLIKKKKYHEFETEITNLRNQSFIKGFLTEINIGFDDLYNFYLLKNISYYLLKYIRQKELHVQAHWLLDAWEAALANTQHTLKPSSVFE